MSVGPLARALRQLGLSEIANERSCLDAVLGAQCLGKRYGLLRFTIDQQDIEPVRRKVGRERTPNATRSTGHKRTASVAFLQPELRHACAVLGAAVVSRPVLRVRSCIHKASQTSRIAAIPAKP